MAAYIDTKEMEEDKNNTKKRMKLKWRGLKLRETEANNDQQCPDRAKHGIKFR